MSGISSCFPKGERGCVQRRMQVGVVYFYPRSTLVLPCWSPQDGGRRNWSDLNVSSV